MLFARSRGEGNRLRREADESSRGRIEGDPCGERVVLSIQQSGPPCFRKGFALAHHEKTPLQQDIKAYCIHCHSLDALFAGGLIEVRDKVFPPSCRAGGGGWKVPPHLPSFFSGTCSHLSMTIKPPTTATFNLFNATFTSYYTLTAPPLFPASSTLVASSWSPSAVPLSPYPPYPTWLLPRHRELHHQASL